MSTSHPGSPVDNGDETTQLLVAADTAEIQTGQRSRASNSFIEIYSATKATLCCSYANLMLPLIPLGVIAGALEWSSAWIFALNFGAILPLAAMLSYSTEQLSASVGQTFGGLINATFGNAVEMIVSLTVTCHNRLPMGCSC